MYKMANEDELQKYMTLIEYYKEQLKTLEYQFSLIQSTINDQTKAKITLEKLNNVKNDSELLLPIGGGTFINASLQNSSKVLYDVGEGIVIEKTIEDTIKNVDKRIIELQQTEEKISKMAQQIQDEATNAQNQAEKILSQNQK
jgi:prefoldin alpha subunit